MAAWGRVARGLGSREGRMFSVSLENRDVFGTFFSARVCSRGLGPSRLFSATAILIFGVGARASIGACVCIAEAQHASHKFSDLFKYCLRGFSIGFVLVSDHEGNLFWRWPFGVCRRSTSFAISI